MSTDQPLGKRRVPWNWLPWIVAGSVACLLVWGLRSGFIQDEGKNRQACEQRGGHYVAGGRGGDSVCLDPAVLR